MLARRLRHRRLNAAIDQWALGAINNSPGGRAFYDQHRAGLVRFEAHFARPSPNTIGGTQQASCLR